VLPAWWGWTLLGLGVVSGVLWALVQHDLKRWSVSPPPLADGAGPRVSFSPKRRS